MKGRIRVSPETASAAPTGKLTPVMQQFAAAKAEHPDAVIFFRLGDFYEMFYDDAVIASRELGITLTSRNKDDPDSEPMAGVPHHAAQGYIARMLQKGHKIAICEQLADPKSVKGIVPRAVVRVITPGLVTDEDQLDARDNHFLAAVEQGDGTAFGVALLDLSTGELCAAEVGGALAAVAELCRGGAKEILLAPRCADLVATLSAALPGVSARVLPQADVDLDADAEIERLLGFAAARDAEANLPKLARAAAARALGFAAACSPRFGVPVRRVGLLPVSDTMQLDDTAQAHLEIVRGADGSKRGTLLAAIDRTITAFGARALRRRVLAPSTDVALIRQRLALVELFVLHPRVRRELRELLAAIPDLERIAVKAALRQITPRDAALLRRGLEVAPALVRVVEGLPSGERDLARVERVDPMPELCALLVAALAESPPASEKELGLVRDGFDPALDEARRLTREGSALIIGLESRLREETQAQGLRVKYNSVFGWYIEVGKSQLGKVPAKFRRKQTVATGERFSSDELDQLAADLESAEQRAKARETLVWERITLAVREAELGLRALAHVLGEWDVASALAELAHQLDYAKPEVDGSDVIAIEAGRHPVVEAFVEKGRFVPNDTALDRQQGRLFLITGPNMAGKSTLMRQVALITIMAQAGSYVPAKRARIGVVDKLLSRVGASDNLARGQSTFMVEMMETASILRQATQRSLLVLDEIGRGTSTYDGLAIAWAVAEHIHDVVRCRALFATHYHELTVLAESAPHVVNMSVSAREHAGGVVFLHRLVPGPASRSYGIAVAKLAGLPEPVLARARAVLGELEGGTKARGGGAKETPQLSLFGAPSAAQGAQPSREERAVLDAVRAADPDRLSPLEALTLLAELKKRLGSTPSS